MSNSRWLTPLWLAAVLHMRGNVSISVPGQTANIIHKQFICANCSICLNAQMQICIPFAFAQSPVWSISSSTLCVSTMFSLRPTSERCVHELNHEKLSRSDLTWKSERLKGEHNLRVKFPRVELFFINKLIFFSKTNLGLLSDFWCNTSTRTIWCWNMRRREKVSAVIVSLSLGKLQNSSLATWRRE